MINKRFFGFVFITVLAVSCISSICFSKALDPSPMSSGKVRDLESADYFQVKEYWHGKHQFYIFMRGADIKQVIKVN